MFCAKEKLILQIKIKLFTLLLLHTVVDVTPGAALNPL